MYIQRHTKEWWFEPRLPKPKVHLPAGLRRLDPTKTDEMPRVSKSRVGEFLPSRKWVPYNRLQALEAGYLVPLYRLPDIAKRYGLSEAGKRYFRSHILPEPFEVMRRRAVAAHHWSRFTLMALDVVLKDLERKGRHQILREFEDHVELIAIGAEYMHDHYASKLKDDIAHSYDEFGVEWFD